MKKIITLFTILILGSLFLQAQQLDKFGKAAEVTTKSVSKMVPTKALPEEVVPSQALHNNLLKIVLPDQASHISLPQAQLQRVQRSWFEQQKRNWKAHQLHKQRQTRDLNLQIQAQERAKREALLATLPKANPAHQFIAKDFENLVPAQIAAQELPFIAQPNVLYRGLALSTDGQAIKNILQNGLRISDVGTEARTHILAATGGMPGVGRALADTPLTNLTSFPTDAQKWATKRLTDQKPILTLVVVNGQTEAGKIVMLAEDIPASQIEEVIVRLNIEGNSTWCKVELNEDNTFTLTPYEPAYQPK